MILRKVGMYMYVSRGGVGWGDKRKKKVGSRIVRFQTNNSNKCDVSKKKKKKTRETIVLCRIN